MLKFSVHWIWQCGSQWWSLLTKFKCQDGNRESNCMTILGIGKSNRKQRKLWNKRVGINAELRGKF